MESEVASANTSIMTMSHIVQGLEADLRGAAAKKQVVKSGTASQGGVFADRPLVRPNPPHPVL